MGLVNGILKKIQFQQNNTELSLLDNETVNDDVNCIHFLLTFFCIILCIVIIFFPFDILTSNVYLTLIYFQGETEWQTFLHHCIECIAKAAETNPLQVFNLVVSKNEYTHTFNSMLTIY